jgi:LmbE family N-acetylglucosaminyl deacetylase
MAVIASIFAHQDDETFSAGGVLAKNGKEGKSYAITVTSDPSRREEFNNACSILDTEPIILDYPKVRPQDIMEIKDEIMDYLLSIQPNHVITHLDFDYHHEHRAVRDIVEEAVEWVSHTTGSKQSVQVNKLWAAETTILIPFPELYVDISSVNEQRLDAISCYESQSHKGGKGFYSKFHNKRTELRGIQSGVEHAEAYLQIPIALSGSFKPKKVYDNLPL